MWSTIFCLLALSATFVLSSSTTLDCKHHAELHEHLFCDLSEQVEGEVVISGFHENLNFENEKTVTINYKNLRDFLPVGVGGLFKELKSFDASLSSVKIVTKSCFENMENLIDLRLYHNEIASLPEDVFTELHNLQYLNIDRNKITKFDPKLIATLSKLKKFDASYNELREIPNNFFDNNSELREIFLNGNKIFTIGLANFNDDFLATSKIETLDFTGNFGACDKKYDSTSDDREELKKFVQTIMEVCNVFVHRF